jgi:crotonobetainyl-CoA:carnitine CoA-transferase CaiB-like acyl-CoA transferase
LDFQFEVLTTYLNDGGQPPERSSVNNAHAYLGAPYGIYETLDGYLALAMGSVIRLGELLGSQALMAFSDPKSWFLERDKIKSILVEHLQTQTTQAWLNVLEPADYWCADVYTWERLLAHEGFQTLNMVHEISRPGSKSLKTTGCPIRINGLRPNSTKWAPRIGENNEELEREFILGSTSG